jgi:predicted transposase YbfD/YdcC
MVISLVIILTKGPKMASKSRKDDYTDLEKEIDMEEFRDSVLVYFSNIPDPRQAGNLTYKLEHIFFIILSAMLAGANSINQIAIFAKAKSRWIKELIPIETIPCYGIFWWVLVRIKPEFLRLLLSEWLSTLSEESRDKILNIDGKCLRGTQKSATLNPHLHLVSLFSAEEGIVLAQQPVEDKSNEITAIPKVLSQIDIQGAIITSDAMGCQKNIAKTICEGKADYMLALKGNQESLADEIENYFNQADAIDFEGVDCDAIGAKENGHGRIEKREIYVTEDIEWLPQKEEWANLKSIVMIKSERLVTGQSPTFEKRYYISSLPANALKVANAIRKHWRVENNLHRQLDINFEEDKSVVNTGYAAENLAIFRRIALNILGSGKGLLERRRNAAWNEEYLTELVSKFFIKSF